jgi:hypothetical protein
LEVLGLTFLNLEIKKIVAENFRQEVEESGVEVLLILTSETCDF